jgi:predicted transcriptional regulator
MKKLKLKLKEKETVEVRLHIQKDDWKTLQEIAAHEDRTSSAQARVAIRQHVDNWLDTQR